MPEPKRAGKARVTKEAPMGVVRVKTKKNSLSVIADGTGLIKVVAEKGRIIIEADGISEKTMLTTCCTRMGSPIRIGR